VVARPPQVITRSSACAARQVRVATASSHTHVLPVPGRTRFYTHTSRPRRPADDICTGVCPVTGMLARRLTIILPTMTLAEAIETTRIHRVAGRTVDRTALVTTCPSRAPHHTISDVGLIGGGHVPMPGSQLWILPLTCHHGSAVADVAAAGVEGPIGGAAGRGRPAAGRSAPRCRAAGSPVPPAAVYDRAPGGHRRTALERATRLRQWTRVQAEDRAAACGRRTDHHGLGAQRLVSRGTACALSPSGSRRLGARAVGRPWPWRLPLEASSLALSRARDTVPSTLLPEGVGPARLACPHADSSWVHDARCWSD
jgi:hypothetical protein